MRVFFRTGCTNKNIQQLAFIILFIFVKIVIFEEVIKKLRGTIELNDRVPLNFKFKFMLETTPWPWGPKSIEVELLLDKHPSVFNL